MAPKLSDYGVRLHSLRYQYNQDKNADSVQVRGLTQGKCEKGSIIASGCEELENSIRHYNTYTLDLLDATIVKIQSHGMKALISPHDANLLNNHGDDSKPEDIYGNTWGSGDSRRPSLFSLSSFDHG